ncbi:MAG: hypothetical protein M3O46_21190 [Myxococcota bacterium]|nr:hypothetical protein [Myxococcota bacterium]
MAVKCVVEPWTIGSLVAGSAGTFAGRGGGREHMIDCNTNTPRMGAEPSGGACMARTPDRD